MAVDIPDLHSVTALLTPFRQGRMDRSELQRAVDRQIAAGVSAILICDHIGEGYALTQDERDAVLLICREQSAGRLALIVATGCNDTAKTIERSRRAEVLGAAALLVTVPFYSKPALRGVANHFHAIAQETRLPLIVDDDPGRTGLDHGQSLLSLLADIPSVVGIRHGPGRLEAFYRLPTELKQRFRHWTADDFTVALFRACGGHGCISARGNICPGTLDARSDGTSAADEMMQALLVVAGGRWDAAALKTCASLLHGSSAEVRLPLVPLDPPLVAAIREAIAAPDAGPAHRALQAAQ